jgi:ethanolamine utilization protein EutQ (cupin superfamily)
MLHSAYDELTQSHAGLGFGRLKPNFYCWPLDYRDAIDIVASARLILVLLEAVLTRTQGWPHVPPKSGKCKLIVRSKIITTK